MKEKIIQEYQNGKSISALEKEYPLSYRAIRKLLVDNQIPIRGGRKKKILSPEELAKVKELYEEGTGVARIGKIVGYSEEKIIEIIRENNFERTVNPFRKVNKRIKEDYFSIIDCAEKAYWLGFLFTDGSVDENQGKRRIRLQLQAADKEILEKFKEDLCLDCKLIEDKRENSTCYSVEFTSVQMFNDLSKYGIVPRKTYETEHLPIDLIPQQFLTSFILGLFDGDGSLSVSQDCSTDVTIHFTSYHKTIAEDFQNILDKIIQKPIHNDLYYTTAWHCGWRGRLQVLKILDILYKDCPRHLQRKYNKYLLLKNSLN